MTTRDTLLRLANQGSDITCQFCGETDFDAIGLKTHIARGWCETFEAIEAYDLFARLRAAAEGEKDNG